MIKKSSGFVENDFNEIQFLLEAWIAFKPNSDLFALKILQAFPRSA